MMVKVYFLSFLSHVSFCCSVTSPQLLQGVPRMPRCPMTHSICAYVVFYDLPCLLDCSAESWRSHVSACREGWEGCAIPSRTRRSYSFWNVYIWERLSLSLGSSPLIVQILPKKHSFFSRCTISRHPPDKSQVYFANNV